MCLVCVGYRPTMGEAVYLHSNTNISQLLQTPQLKADESFGDIFRQKVWSQLLLLIFTSHLGNLPYTSRTYGISKPAFDYKTT